jgi:hypothetical protein
MLSLAVPSKLLRQAEQYTRRFGPDWSEFAAIEPTLGHYWAIIRVKELVQYLIEDLTEPQPVGDLTLRKQRRHDD